MRLDRLFGGSDYSGSSGRTSVCVEKPDLLSVVAQIDNSRMDGCLFCGKTIFFNGSSWRHADDHRPCENARCDAEPTGGTVPWTYTYTKWVSGFWGNKPVEKTETKTHPEVKCRHCGRTGWSDSGWWLYVPGEEPGPGSSDPVGMVRKWCPSKVATPASQGVSE